MQSSVLELPKSGVRLQTLREVLGALCVQLVVCETANASRVKASIARRHEQVSMAADIDIGTNMYADSKQRAYGQGVRT